MGMKMIEEKTLEYIKQKVEEFSLRIKAIYKAKSVKEEWLDNQDVCQLLDISLRTLQNYRNKGVLPYSQIGYKCYYKIVDVEAFIESSKENNQTK